MIRRQAFLTPPSPEAGTTNLRRRIAEASGKAAADCAALCCCGPCGVVNLVVLAIYRVPAGLCRRVRSKRLHVMRARRKKSGGLGMNGPGSGQSLFEGFLEGEDSVVDLLKKEREGDGGGLEEDEEELEREMWERFSRTGFWRSPSTRDA